MADFTELSPDLMFLVVDESQTIRDIVGTTLKKMGLKQVQIASDCLRALEMLRDDKVDFIICDRNFRQMSGMEFLKEIRETTSIPRVPFMMMAGEISKEDVILASEFGVDGYLKKPFVMKDISVRIAACVQKFNTPGNSEALFEEARVLYSKAKFAEALECYSKLVPMFPNSARARVGIGRCYRSLGDYPKAIEELLAAIEKNEMYVHTHHELGLCYLQENNFDQALRSFTKAIELSPGNPARYESAADILFKNEKYREAEEILMKAVKLELVYPVLFEQLGRVLFAQKKIDRAYLYFEKALKQQPENVSFLNSMGICMKEMGRFEEAVNYYNSALKYRTQDVKIMFNKLLCLVELKQTERAIKTCHQILKIDPDYEKAKRKLAALMAPAAPASTPPAKT